MRKLFFLMLMIPLHFCLAAEEEMAGKVVSVIDGNTIELALSDEESYKILLYGIDCPELPQNFGDEAKAYLEKMLLNKTVVVKIQGKDRWGTRMGIVMAKGGDDPRIKLLEAGLAWTTEKNPVEELEALKEQAKQKGKGLWKESDPTPPWIFRRQQTLLTPKSS